MGSFWSSEAVLALSLVLAAVAFAYSPHRLFVGQLRSDAVFGALRTAAEAVRTQTAGSGRTNQ